MSGITSGYMGQHKITMLEFFCLCFMKDVFIWANAGNFFVLMLCVDPPKMLAIHETIFYLHHWQNDYKKMINMQSLSGPCL